MNLVIAGAALVALGIGAKYIMRYAVDKRRRREQRAALQTWEGEGGAVSVEPNRTTAQVMPRGQARIDATPD